MTNTSRKSRRVRKSKWWLSMLLATGLPAVCAPSQSEAQQFGARYGLGHVAGEGVGLDDGYTRIGAFVPLMQPSSDVLFFTDTHLLLYNEQTEAKGGNLGGGVRYFDAAMNRIFGGYTYYDYRDRDIAQYHQVGFGFETLGSVFDARMNVNLPTNTDVQQVSSGLLGTPRFGGAAGQNIIVGVEGYQQALTTIDSELGGLLYGEDAFQIKAFIGGYGLYGQDQSEAGVKGRLEFRVNDTAWVNGFLQNDGLFGTTGGMSVEFRFGRGNPGSSLQSVSNRMNDPVHRRNHIAVHDTYQDILATAAGNAITVLHVDSNSAAGSGGVFDPVNTLAAASNQPQDIVFVHGDSVFDGESILVSTEGQRLLGEGFAHSFVSDQGSFLLPRVNPNAAAPRIINAPDTAITVAADNVEVAGFAIADTGRFGIFGDGVSGFDVHNNTIERAFVGVFFDNVNGTGSIQSNTANNNQFLGISVVGNMTGDIANNTANDNSGLGYASGIVVDGNLDGNMIFNTTNGNQGIGIVVAGNVTGDLAANTANNSDGGSGIVVQGRVNGLVQANSANNNERYGMEIGGDVIGDVLDNVTNENGDGGLVVEGQLIGSLARNEANDNLNSLGLLQSGSGLFVLGGVEGDIVENSTNANAVDGMFIRSDVTGDVSGNWSQENGGNGITIVGDLTGDMNNNNAVLNAQNGARVLGSQTGNVVGNTFDDNGNGLFISGSLVGEVRDNIASGNNDQGIDIANNLTSTAVTGNMTNRNLGHGLRVGGDVLRAAPGNPVVFENNQANENRNNGFEFAGNVDAVIRDTVANDNGGHGLRVGGLAVGQVIQNQTNANGGSGMRFEGDVAGLAAPGSAPLAFASNEANGNGTAGLHNGIHVGGGVYGSVAGNVTNDNSVNGFQAGDVAGEYFYNNTANNNQFNGIVLEDVNVPGAGRFSLNTANGNGGDGIRMNDTNATISNNTASNNGDDGIDVDGTLFAAPGPNTLLGNGDADGGDLDNSGFEGDQPGE
ncbi:beta strand repeat-containing protein [Rosistilla oblonga]|uniref:beta strand repeat-containing protein n=1 Tax=Rosistilla oblonga TaxID=2527990 RepID=UPI003A970DE8